MKGQKANVRRFGFALGLAAFMFGCGFGEKRPKLLPLSLPDLSRVDPGVQAQTRERYDTLTQKLARRDTPLAELGDAYGAFGMVLHAAEYFDAAETAYLDAQMLAPAEIKWPYYLAGVYKSKGDTSKAEASYRRVLELRPDDLATLIWLGRLYLDQGRADAAEPLFSKAVSEAPRTVAALAGLGRVALAKRDYGRAAKHFEDALAVDPEAESLNTQLAAAYRGLGQLDKAEPLLRHWRNRDSFVPDPLGQELDLLLESGLSYELRGVRAFEARDWKTAEAFFRKGLTLSRDNTPLTRSLHHKLGTALVLMGEVSSAVEQFDEVTRLAPEDGVDESAAKAHYSLGIVLEEKGRHADALEHLAAAVKYQPNYVEAHLALADALRRSPQRADPGRSARFKASLAHYDEAMKINPRSTPARLGYALALAALGRWQQARDWLIESTMLYADRQEFWIALARLLAASPDDRVRDGRRALAVADKLLEKQKSTSVGETVAMALAELGDYNHAVGIQRGIIAAAETAGPTASVRRMNENLRLYERHRPCRTPWPIDQPVVLSESPFGPLTAAVQR